MRVERAACTIRVRNATGLSVTTPSGDSQMLRALCAADPAACAAAMHSTDVLDAILPLLVNLTSRSNNSPVDSIFQC